MASTVVETTNIANSTTATTTTPGNKSKRMYSSTTRKNLLTPSSAKKSGSEMSADELVRRLTNIELIIEKFFALPDSWPLLERKIEKLEDMIAYFPDARGKDADGWRDKVISMYQRMAALQKAAGIAVPESTGGGAGALPKSKAALSNPKSVAGNNNNNKQSQSSGNSSSSTRTLSASLVVRNVGGGKTVSKGRGPRKQTFRNNRRGFGEHISAGGDPGRNSRNYRFKDLVPPNDEPLTKESLRPLLTEALKKLEPVKQLSDLGDMQKLLTMVAKVVKVITPFRDDAELQQELLDLVLPKLPADVVERFNNAQATAAAEAEAAAESKEEEEEEEETTNEEEGDEGEEKKEKTTKVVPVKSLHSLKKSLILELTAYYNALKEAAANNAAGTGTDDEAANEESDKQCYYCKELGHFSFRCPQATTMLCFRCFRNGHKARDCGRRCYKCQRYGHISKECKN